MCGPCVARFEQYVSISRNIVTICGIPSLYIPQTILTRNVEAFVEDEPNLATQMWGVILVLKCYRTL
jgi:hypothetical protein